jgi:hypothetical protein
MGLSTVGSEARPRHEWNEWVVQCVFEEDRCLAPTSLHEVAFEWLRGGAETRGSAAARVAGLVRRALEELDGNPWYDRIVSELLRRLGIWIGCPARVLEAAKSSSVALASVPVSRQSTSLVIDCGVMSSLEALSRGGKIQSLLDGLDEGLSSGPSSSASGEHIVEALELQVQLKRLHAVFTPAVGRGPPSGLDASAEMLSQLWLRELGAVSPGPLLLSCEATTERELFCQMLLRALSGSDPAPSGRSAVWDSVLVKRWVGDPHATGLPCVPLDELARLCESDSMGACLRVLPSAGVEYPLEEGDMSASATSLWRGRWALSWSPSHALLAHSCQSEPSALLDAFREQLLSGERACRVAMHSTKGGGRLSSSFGLAALATIGSSLCLSKSIAVRDDKELLRWLLPVWERSECLLSQGEDLFVSVHSHDILLTKIGPSSSVQLPLLSPQGDVLSAFACSPLDRLLSRGCPLASGTGDRALVLCRATPQRHSVEDTILRSVEAMLAPAEERDKRWVLLDDVLTAAGSPPFVTPEAALAALEAYCHPRSLGCVPSLVVVCRALSVLVSVQSEPARTFRSAVQFLILTTPSPAGTLSEPCEALVRCATALGVPLRRVEGGDVGDFSVASPLDRRFWTRRGMEQPEDSPCDDMLRWCRAFPGSVGESLAASLCLEEHGGDSSLPFHAGRFLACVALQRVACQSPPGWITGQFEDEESRSLLEFAGASADGPFDRASLGAVVAACLPRDIAAGCPAAYVSQLCECIQLLCSAESVEMGDVWASDVVVAPPPAGTLHRTGIRTYDLSAEEMGGSSSLASRGASLLSLVGSPRQRSESELRNKLPAELSWLVPLRSSGFRPSLPASASHAVALSAVRVLEQFKLSQGGVVAALIRIACSGSSWDSVVRAVRIAGGIALSCASTILPSFSEPLAFDLGLSERGGGEWEPPRMAPPLHAKASLTAVAECLSEMIRCLKGVCRGQRGSASVVASCALTCRVLLSKARAPPRAARPAKRRRSKKGGQLRWSEAGSDSDWGSGEELDKEAEESTKGVVDGFPPRVQQAIVALVEGLTQACSVVLSELAGRSDKASKGLLNELDSIAESIGSSTKRATAASSRLRQVVEVCRSRGEMSEETLHASPSITPSDPIEPLGLTLIRSRTAAGEDTPIPSFSKALAELHHLIPGEALPRGVIVAAREGADEVSGAQVRNRTVAEWLDEQDREGREEGDDDADDFADLDDFIVD